MPVLRQLGRSPHGERGLKSHASSTWLRRCGRSPHGERGLKSRIRQACFYWIRSLSSWRAWIEIGEGRRHVLGCHRRSPHGERGLKYCKSLQITAIIGRSPHGERGLKSTGAVEGRSGCTSLSSWRAWIEMQWAGIIAHPVKSLSSWRAWIEIKMPRHHMRACSVALLMESVD